VFNFIRKSTLFDAWDKELHKQISHDGKYHLKTAQDLAVFTFLHDLRGKRIAEVGGGNSRILSATSKLNECYNIEKFEGADGGPSEEIHVKNVKNILAYLGEGSKDIPRNFFDVVFSVSVVEHVPLDGLDSFFREGLESLKPGGLWLHAIDIYIEDNPSAGWEERFEAYRNWALHPLVRPLGEIYSGPLKFSCDMATNPDSTMYQWGKISPGLIDLRKRAQSASILVAVTKR